MEENKINNNNEKGKMNKIKHIQQEELRDTSGDTKVFQIIRKEDIEKEKRRQANEKKIKLKKKTELQKQEKTETMLIKKTKQEKE